MTIQENTHASTATHTHTTIHTAPIIQLPVKNTGDTYIKPR